MEKEFGPETLWQTVKQISHYGLRKDAQMPNSD
jgi:hypothetical protein